MLTHVVVADAGVGAVALVAAASTSGLSVISLLLAVLGVLALLASSVIVVFGARNKTVATQQSQTIDAMAVRLDLMENENKELRGELGEARGAIDILKDVAGNKTMIQKGFVALGVDPAALR